jgi:hypothetical protein
MLHFANQVSLQILEDYEKQLQHLKKELEALNGDYGEWEQSRIALR